jgi:hypothetical protein
VSRTWLAAALPAKMSSPPPPPLTWPGSAIPIPDWWSTHVAHAPSAQFACSAEVCAGPRCSAQPGQAHRKPHVQPEPASDATALSGGIGGKFGGGSVLGMSSSSMRIGGSSGPRSGRGGVACLPAQQDRLAAGRVGVGEWRPSSVRFLRTVGEGESTSSGVVGPVAGVISVSQHSVAARASVASP